MEFRRSLKTLSHVYFFTSQFSNDKNPHRSKMVEQINQVDLLLRSTFNFP